MVSELDITDAAAWVLRMSYTRKIHLGELEIPLFCATAVHSFKLSRNHVDWHSMDEVYLYSDATTSKIARTVTQKLGFSKGNGHTL